MAIKIKYATVNRMDVMEALNFLCQQNLDSKVAWNIARIRKQCMKVSFRAREAFQLLIKKYAKHDASGRPVFEMSPEEKDESGKVIKESQPIPGKFIYNSLEAQAEFDVEYAKLLETEVIIPSNPIKCTDITLAKVPAALFDALDDLLEQDEDIIEVTKAEVKAPLTANKEAEVVKINPKA